MRENIRRAAAHAGLFCGLLALLWLFLSCSAMVPNHAIKAQFERSALSYAQADPFQFHGGERWNAIGDNYADAILLNVAWNMGEGNPFAAAIHTDYYDGEEMGENTGLYLSVTEGAAPNTDYTRYWHGGAMVLRPLHLVTDVDGIKTLGFGIILALLALTAGVIMKNRHSDLALLLVLSFVAVQGWNTRLSLEYQTAFLLTFLLCPLYLWLEKKGDRWLTLLSVAGGTAIAFFDFLTTETLTLLLPLLLVVAVRAKEGRLAPLRESLFLLVQCALCWGGAYVGAFLVKWTAASVVTGENAFALALSSAAERVGGAVLLGEEPPKSILSAIAANLTMVFGGTARVQTSRVLVGLGVYVGILGSLWYLFRREGSPREGPVLVLALGSLVFLRYLVLNNHSYLHEFFTYRALAAPVLATLVALRLSTGPPGRKGVRR